MRQRQEDSRLPLALVHHYPQAIISLLILQQARLLLADGGGRDPNLQHFVKMTTITTITTMRN